MQHEAPTLIIIDMQKGMAEPAAGVRNNPQAEQHIAALLLAWRRAGAIVVHVRHLSRHPDSPFWPGQRGVQFQDGLMPLAGEHIVDKNVPCAFVHTGLERWLRVRGITRLLLAGVSTNNSVEACARTAGNLGFAVQVLADATFAFAATDYAGTPRTADQVHAMSLANLQHEYAAITDTASALAGLERQRAAAPAPH